MKNLLLCALLCAFNPITTQAADTVPGSSPHNPGMLPDHNWGIQWVGDSNLVNTLCKNHHPLWSSFTPEGIEKGTHRTATQICDDEGRMNWYEAQAWIDHLNAKHFLGRNDWRLPKISYRDQHCSDLVQIEGHNEPVRIGHGCVNSESGHLHSLLKKTGKRLYGMEQSLYWTETELDADSTLVGVFDVQTNWQDAEGKTTDLLHVWPVHAL